MYWLLFLYLPFEKFTSKRLMASLLLLICHNKHWTGLFSTGASIARPKSFMRYKRIILHNLHGLMVSIFFTSLTWCKKKCNKSILLSYFSFSSKRVEDFSVRWSSHCSPRYNCIKIQILTNGFEPLFTPISGECSTNWAT